MPYNDWVRGMIAELIVFVVGLKGVKIDRSGSGPKTVKPNPPFSNSIYSSAAVFYKIIKN